MTTTSTQMRDQHNALREQLAEARTRRVEARRAVEAARERFLSASVPAGTKVTDTPEFQAAERATTNLGTIEEEIASLQGQQEALLRLMDGGGNGNLGGGGLGSGMVFGEATREWLVSHAPRNVRLPSVTIEGDDWRGGESLGTILDREATAQRFGSRLIESDTPPTTSLGASVDDSGAPTLYEGARESRIERALRLAPRLTQFFAAVPKDDGDSYKYTQEIGTWDTARETTPGAIKSQADVDYVDKETTYARIAHWIKVHKDKLSDATDLDAALREGLISGGERRLEGQIIAGNGTDPNLRGLFNTSGIADEPFVSGTALADLILRGIAKVIAAGGMPNVTAVSVTDWVNLLLAKTSGSGDYLGGGPFGPMPPTIWFTTLVPVPLMATGDALVADTTGGRILVREGWSVVFGQESDDMIRNMVTALGEARFGFEVRQPAKFCRVNLAA